MDFLPHLTINTTVIGILGTILVYSSHEYKIFLMCAIAIWWGVIYPDGDHKLKNTPHRHFLFHSIIITSIFWVISLLYPMLALLIALMNFSIGIHLICDIHVKRAKMIGTYTIKFIRVRKFKLKKEHKIYGLNGMHTTEWLVVNFIVSVGILLIQLMVIM